jgi:hypothetical protein
LFYYEEGKIKDEIRQEGLYSLEHEVVAKSIGLAQRCWLDVMEQVSMALTDGTMDKIRSGIIWSFYGRQ